VQWLMEDLPLLLFFTSGPRPSQSRTSQITMVLSLPPVTKIGLPLWLVKLDANIRPSCALKVEIVS
jgi:hypothetical protein